MQRLQALLLLSMTLTSACQCLGSATYRPAPIRPAEVMHSLDAGLRSATSLSTVADGHAVQNAGAAEYRKPETAFCLACLIAGGGHFYTGETRKGAALLGIAAGSLIAGAALSGGDDYDGCNYNPETFECESSGGHTPLLIGAGIAAG